ncbi:isochorismatase family protein [Leifsonia sp. 2MCAF36]|uniref:isochorismatase family protein n=1 Tax=Leifsonia sp. 2MCAF36 TaxID=3232988 RepID=UPI003F96E8F7
MHPTYVRQSARSQRTSGLEQYKQEILEVRAAFPDLLTIVDKLIVSADGASAAVFWHSSGSFLGELQNVPATGRRVETRGSNLLTLKDGLITHESVTWDHAELLADLGIPSLKSAFEPDSEKVVVDVPGATLHPDSIKGFNRQFVTGVTVVTTIDSRGNPRGLAANSYASVSLEPPLVLVCVQKTAGTYGALFSSTHLGINIVSNAQRDVVSAFAAKIPDKFAHVKWHVGPDGSPLIDGSAASIEAEIKERFQARTHTVFVARVTHAEVSDVDPMVYKAGRFHDGGEPSTVVWTRFVRDPQELGGWREYYDRWNKCRSAPESTDWDLTLPIRAEDHLLSLPTFSKWGAELAAITAGEDHIIVCGVATDCCVLSTVFGAIDAGKSVTVVTDACAGVTDEAHQQAISLLDLLSPMVTLATTDEMITQSMQRTTASS